MEPGRRGQGGDAQNGGEQPDVLRQRERRRTVQGGVEGHGRGKPVARILGQGLHQHLVAPFADPRQGQGRGVAHGVHQPLAVGNVEGENAGDQFVEDDRQGVPVHRRPGGRKAEKLLRGHVSLDLRRDLGIPARRLGADRRRQCLGDQGEVEQFDLAALGDHDVFRAQIPMQDGALGMIQGLGDPSADLQRLGKLQPFAGGGQTVLLEVDAVHMLGDQKMAARSRIGLQGVDLGDVGVVEAVQQGKIAFEVGQLPLVAVDLGRDGLDRHHHAGDGIVRQMGGAEQPLAEGLADGVAGGEERAGLHARLCLSSPTPVRDRAAVSRMVCLQRAARTDSRTTRMATESHDRIRQPAFCPGWMKSALDCHCLIPPIIVTMRPLPREEGFLASVQHRAGAGGRVEWVSSRQLHISKGTSS